MQHLSLNRSTVVGAVLGVVFGQPVERRQQLVLILWLMQELLGTHGHPLASTRRSKIQTHGRQFQQAESVKLTSWTKLWSMMRIFLIWGGNISCRFKYSAHVKHNHVKNNLCSLVCNLIPSVIIFISSPRVSQSGSVDSGVAAKDTRQPPATSKPKSASTSRKRKRSPAVQRAHKDPESR